LNQAATFTTSDLTQAEDTAKPSRGRPRINYVNPVADYMHLLASPEPLPWVEDIVRGSIATSAGTTNGKVNVKVRAVLAALFLTGITADACQTGEYTLRTAQRVAKAARHAAHGIVSYIERHPEIKGALAAELGTEALYQGLRN